METKDANKIFNSMKSLNEQEQRLQLEKLDLHNFKLLSAIKNYEYLYNDNKKYFHEQITLLNLYNQSFFEKAIKYNFNILDHFDKYCNYRYLIKLKKNLNTQRCLTKYNLDIEYLKIIFNKINDNDIILNWFLELLNQADIINKKRLVNLLTCKMAEKGSSNFILYYMIYCFTVKDKLDLKIFDYLNIDIINQFYKQCLKYLKRNAIKFYYTWKIFYSYLDEANKNIYLNMFVEISIKRLNVIQLSNLDFNFLSNEEQSKLQSKLQLVIMYKKMGV